MGMEEETLAVFGKIEVRLSAMAGMPVSHMDPIRVSKCDPKMLPDGQALADGDYAKRFGRKTVFIFLNDVQEGGELRFPRLGLQVRPREGCAVMWSVTTDD